MRQLFILVLIFLNLFLVKGQEKMLQFKQLTTDEGLSNSQVVSILQDYKGYMWIGTYSGLNRYDGKNVVIYKNIADDSTSIRGNVAKAIFEDYKKRLFIGTFQGLSMYNRDLDCFVNFGLDKSSVLYQMEMSIFSIAGDTLGNLWIGSSSGLFQFNVDNNTLVRFTHIPNDPAGLSNDFVEHVFLDSKQRLWVSTHKGLNVLNTKIGIFDDVRPFLMPNDIHNNKFYHSAIEDKTGNLWFGTYEGLFCYEENLIENNTTLSHYSNNPANATSLSHNYVVSLFVDDDNNLWIGTENGGINLFNRESKTFFHYRIDEFNSKSLNNESIWALAKDRNKNFWVGTFGGGVNISVNESDFIIHYKSISGAPNSLGHNIVKAFLEDDKNKLWVATDGGGLNQFDIHTGRFNRITTSNSNLSSNAVLCLQQGGSNQIWMGTWAGGLVSYNTKTKVFKSYTTKNSNITDDNIHSIAKDSKGNLWLGSQKGGLIFFNVKFESFKAYLPENSDISHNRVSDVCIDKNDNVYFAATISMQIFNPSENKFTTYATNPEIANSISSNYIIDILIQNDTCVWLGSAEGLNRFNPLTKEFTKYFEADGLPSNVINAITIDKSNNLWISTANGLSKFDYLNYTSTNFNKSDGLQDNEFTDRSILTLQNGKILVGGINGFNIISPDLIPENKQIPDVVITDFKIFNKPASIGKGEVLTKQISECREITLKHTHSVITFNFAVLDFTNPSKNNYAYMMEGFDENWIYCDNRNEATYTNLNPGKYVFRVKGSNNHGVWNEVGTALKITITPPWWKTKLAISTFILAIVGLFLSFYFYRINQLKVQKVLLEQLVAKRTNDLKITNEQLLEHQIQIEDQAEELQIHSENLKEANNLLIGKQQLIINQTEQLKETNNKLSLLNATKDKFFSIIAHDLKNPFNAIMGLSEILIAKYDSIDDKERKDLLKVVNESSNNLFRLLENLLEWARSQTGSINYRPEEFVINELISSNIALVKNMALKKNIQIIENLEGKIKLFADKNMINTVLRNLITNAIKFTESGSVKIDVTKDSDTITVFVKDSGVGISSDKLNKIFGLLSAKSTSGTQGESGTGLGLILCKEFIEKNGGTIAAFSEPDIGSTFYFTLPQKMFS